MLKQSANFIQLRMGQRVLRLRPPDRYRSYEACARRCYDLGYVPEDDRRQHHLSVRVDKALVGCRMPTFLPCKEEWHLLHSEVVGGFALLHVLMGVLSSGLAGMSVFDLPSFSIGRHGTTQCCHLPNGLFT